MPMSVNCLSFCVPALVSHYLLMRLSRRRREPPIQPETAFESSQTLGVDIDPWSRALFASRSANTVINRLLCEP